MNSHAPSLQAMHTYLEAIDVLTPLAGAVKLLGLLRGVLRSKVFSAPQRSWTPAQVAGVLNMDLVHGTNLCRTLDAHGFLVLRDGKYHVTQKWAALTAAESLLRLEDTIDLAFAESRALEQSVAGESNYWSLTTDDRLALAKGIMLNPASSHSPSFMAWFMQHLDPELHQALAAGGRYLELGCGAGGGLLSLLQAYPKAAGVGVEIAADIIHQTRQLASELGVIDRLDLRHEDACSFRSQDQFDCVHWSQVYFPAHSRLAAIQVARDALRPRGFLIMPLVGEPAPPDNQMHTAVGREFTLCCFLYGVWGVPLVSAVRLRDEIEQAGFCQARMDVEYGYMIARRNT